jgi:hypothetical protein
MGTLQTVLEVSEAAIALAATASMIIATTIHILGFADEEWAKPYLRVSNDIIGFFQARKEAKNAKSDET